MKSGFIIEVSNAVEDAALKSLFHMEDMFSVRVCYPTTDEEEVFFIRKRNGIDIPILRSEMKIEGDCVVNTITKYNSVYYPIMGRKKVFQKEEG